MTVVSISRIFSIGLCVIGLLLAGAAGATTRKPVTNPSAVLPSGATIYFVRPKELKLFSFTFDILVDSQNAGELAAGTYFVINMPAGRHILEVQGNAFVGGIKSEVEFLGGETYFLEVGPNPDAFAPGAQVLQSLTAGGAGLSGKVLPGRGPSGRFYSLDTHEGRDAIAALRNVTR